MKKNLLVVLMSILTSSILCSCSISDSEESVITNATFNTNYLYGKWKLDKVGSYTAWVIDSRYEDNYIQFNSNGTAYADMAIGSGNVKYKVYGNKITLYTDGGDLFYITVNSITSTDLDTKVYLIGDNTPLYYTFKK